MLIYIRDVGIRIQGTRGYMFAEFECPKCGVHIEIRKHQGMSQEQCHDCFRDFHRNTQIKHGDRYTRLYRTWVNMRQRCLNTKSEKYKQYGAKGICICNDWNDYSLFKLWAMSSGYDENLTLDRIDVLGNYEPSNCQWLTNSENSRKGSTIDAERKKQAKSI